jgi:hypothetical protein
MFSETKDVITSKLCILYTHTPYSGPVGGPGEGSPSTGDFEGWMKGALRMGRLSLKSLTAEGLEGGLLYWIPLVMKGRLWRRAFLHGDSVGQPGFVSSTGDFERWLKGALYVGRFSLWELREGNLEEGLPCWGP